jgi:hypothetical protein
MTRPGPGEAGYSRPMSLFGHWLVHCAVRHNAAVKAALALDPKTIGNGRTPGEAEVSRHSVKLFEDLHLIESVVRELGVEAVFGVPDAPLASEIRERYFVRSTTT